MHKDILYIHTISEGALSYGRAKSEEMKKSRSANEHYDEMVRQAYTETQAHKIEECYICLYGDLFHFC